MRKITYTMLCRPYWNNIAQEYYLVNVVQIRLRQHCTKKLPVSNVGSKRKDTLSDIQIYVWKPVLNRYYITEQSSLFLLNAGSGVHLGLAGLQQTGADFDWNNILKNFSDFSRMKLAQNIFVKLVHFVQPRLFICLQK